MWAMSVSQKLGTHLKKETKSSNISKNCPPLRFFRCWYTLDGIVVGGPNGPIISNIKASGEHQDAINIPMASQPFNSRQFAKANVSEKLLQEYI